MASRRLDSRLMNDKLKRGWCACDFANYLGCLEEQFWMIFEQFSEESKIDYRRRLNNNENKRKKQIKPKQHRGNKSQNTAQVPEIHETEKNEQSVDEITVEEVNLAETQETNNSEELLKEKKFEEESIQKEICKCESAICSLNVQKKQVQEELKLIDAELAAIEKRVNTLGEKSEKCISRIQQINENVESFKQNMKVQKTDLEKVREEIKSLETIEIFVYENGDIDLIGIATGEFVVDSIWEKVFQKLRDEEIVEDLTNRQIKLLAKIITYIHVQVNCNVTFEVEELQQVFEKLPDKGLTYFFE